jgi:hypothetical protein
MKRSSWRYSGSCEAKTFRGPPLRSCQPVLSLPQGALRQGAGAKRETPRRCSNTPGPGPRGRPFHAWRTAWHTHPFGQTIYVTEGVGLCQRRGWPVEVIRAGDRVFFEPGEDHWHGAAPNRFMTHIAMQEADDSGSPVAWGEHVTDEEYGAAPAIER